MGEIHSIGLADFIMGQICRAQNYLEQHDKEYAQKSKRILHITEYFSLSAMNTVGDNCNINLMNELITLREELHTIDCITSYMQGVIDCSEALSDLRRIRN